MTTEIERIRSVYEKRKVVGADQGFEGSFAFAHFSRAEREFAFFRALAKNFRDFSQIRFLEIGAGDGDNLYFFNRIGIPWANIVANDLVPHRIEELKSRFPTVQTFVGNAGEMPFENHFDVVFQATVFTSVLDKNLRQQLAQKMLSMLKPGGICLFYDFVFENPANRHYLVPVSVKEVRELFVGGTVEQVQRTTLLPPLARRVGRFYNIAKACLPFLKTHRVITIRKNG